MRYFFGNCILDTDRRELRRGTDTVSIAPQVFDLLAYLVHNRERVASKDDLIAAVWGGRIVSDGALTTRINVARGAIGDSGEEQRLIKTLPRKGFRFIGAVREEDGGQQVAELGERDSSERQPSRTASRQRVEFCRSADGIRIAYATVGSGPALVRASNFVNHLEYDWDSPVWGPFLRAIAAGHRLVRYDGRGCGLSDREPGSISLDAFVDDLAAVIDAARIERCALLGQHSGCATAVAYAVRHPDRVSHLVLYAGFARGARRRGLPQLIEQSNALLTLMRAGWGKENPAFRQFFTARALPDGTPDQIRAFDELQRIMCSPEVAVATSRVIQETDIAHLLPQLTVPTLVLHCRNDALVRFEHGRQLAAAIPGARFVALEGRNHVLLVDDPSCARLIEEMNSFLRE
jgi:DNA-binding winged helix-turn-helix (wHTH) protein/alpha-beta hydrolase superfamily lysophospholipase